MQEVFYGDGTTELFTLSQAAFRGSNRSLVADNFNDATINTLRQRQAELTADYAKLMQQFSPEYPPAMALNNAGDTRKMER